MSQQDKILKNKIEAGSYNPQKIKLLQDRLDEKGKSRLEALLRDIDDNMDDLLKEKAEYTKQGLKTTQGGFSVGGQFDTKS